MIVKAGRQTQLTGIRARRLDSGQVSTTSPCSSGSSDTTSSPRSRPGQVLTPPSSTSSSSWPNNRQSSGPSAPPPVGCICPVCGMTFTTKSNCLRHWRTHLRPDGSNRCDVCKKDYYRPDQLRDHWRREHHGPPSWGR